MNKNTRASEPQSEYICDRSEELDLELWKHHANFGGEDKNRMVTIASWLLVGSAGMLAYSWENLSFENINIWEIKNIAESIRDPVKALGFAILGLGVSILAAYISLLYGGYANRNWEKADRIAKNRGWKDLLPSHETSSGYSLNAIAKRRARDCDPEKTLPPVFKVYFGIAVCLCVLHLGFVICSAKNIGWL
jgi:hypothetical protein